MTMNGQLDEQIILENLSIGNNVELGELIAAYNVVYRRFESAEPQFYSENPVQGILDVTNLRTSLERFVAKNQDVDLRSLEFLVTYAEYMRRQGLPFLFTTAHLYHFLGTNEASVNAMLTDLKSHYHTKLIPKRHGGERRIDAPSSELKAIQSVLNRKLLRHVKLNNAVTGFRAGKSIKDNAEKHQHKYAVFSLDLENFFHSVEQSRVEAALKNLGFTKSIAKSVAQLSCFRQSLPMGAPTSPVLANLVASRLDRRLLALAKKEGLYYSRYADDITLSAKERNGLRVIPLVKEIIEDEGFRINSKKVALHFRHQRQYVTGIVVNDGLNIKREQYKKIRSAIHNASSKGVEFAMKKWGEDSLTRFKSQLEGHVHFISMVNPSKGKKLQMDLSNVQWLV